MSFKDKYEKTQQTEVDEYSRLMCSVPGCQNRWSVHINGEKPKCSMHQWTTTAKPSEKTVQAWYAKDEF